MALSREKNKNVMFERTMGVLAPAKQLIKDEEGRTVSLLSVAQRELKTRIRDAQLLATSPGIRVTLPTLISTEIDQIDRFPSVAKLYSYAGLVPSTHSSGGRIYHGKITSEGNRWLRWALVEAAVPVFYADAEIKE